MFLIVVIACELEFLLIPPSSDSPARTNFSHISKLSGSSFYREMNVSGLTPMKDLVSTYHLCKELSQLGTLLVISTVGVHMDVVR